MKFEAATIKDIGKALGLSTSTVSRALHDSHEISAETKEAVLEYAKKINYHPNPIALSLREKRSRSIGVIVAEIANSFFSQAINGIESVANQKGYNVVIAQSLESYEREVKSMHFLASRSIDGCLVSISAETNDFAHFTELYDKGLPLVFFDRVAAAMDTHKVMSDNFGGAYEATAHLLRNGYSRVALLTNAIDLSITRSRLAGYAKALQDHQVPFDETLVKYCIHGGMMRHETEQALLELLQLDNKPDAVFASSDKLTTNCIRYCSTHKINIPGDLGLIGFSNLDITDLLSPSLSVIRQPAFEMGKVAAELLIKMIEAKRPLNRFESPLLPVELFERESSSKKQPVS
jgi:LacI family transcriptional regulator